MKKEDSRFSNEPIFEGMVSVRALIESREKGENDRRITRLLYDEERAVKEAKELAWLRHRASEQGFSIELTDRATLDGIAIGSTHGGVIAYATTRTLAPLSPDLLPDHGFACMLDGVEDPYNFGYALRSLYAMGVDLVILPERNWMSSAGVVCRASAGASERMTLVTARDEDAVRICREGGYRIVAADLRDSVPTMHADLSLPLLLLIGGEKRGISRRILDDCDLRVRIDYARAFSASLSAASAATMLGYEIFRQNQATKQP